jgi:hypothetical protein
MAEDSAIQDCYGTCVWPAVVQGVSHDRYKCNIVVIELTHDASQAAHG